MKDTFKKRENNKHILKQKLFEIIDTNYKESIYLKNKIERETAQKNNHESVGLQHNFSTLAIHTLTSVLSLIAEYEEERSQKTEKSASEHQENFIYQIFEFKEFQSVEDQEIKTFQDSGVPSEFQSFSLTLNFILRKADQKRKENINIFQTGQTHKKNLVIAITPSNTIMVTFRQGQDKESLFSQTKIKPNLQYELCIVYEVVKEEDEIQFYNSTLYINGKSETNLSMNEAVTKPSGRFYFGSESALGTFVGEISHTYFVTRNLTEEEITNLHNEKKINPMDPKSPYAILEEAQQSQFPAQDRNQFGNKSIPDSLQRTHITLQQNHISGQSQMVVLDNKSMKEMDQHEFESAELRAIFSKDPVLHNNCRELSSYFKWTICTLQQLSPPIEEPGKSALPFTCLHNLIANGRINFQQQFPIYIIEFHRLMKVLSYWNAGISSQQILQLATVTNTVFKLKVKESERQDQLKDFQDQFRKNYTTVNMNLAKMGPEDDLEFVGVLYDKLLIAIRNTVLNEEEINDIKREYMEDEDVKGLVDEANEDEANQDHFQQQQDQQEGENEEEEAKQRSEKIEQLQDEKQKQMYCSPLSSCSVGQTLTYNSYNALLNLLEISNKNKNNNNNEQFHQYTFKGVYLQRTYQSHNTNVLEQHRKFFNTCGSKVNLFTQLEQIFKNMCPTGQDEIDFNSFCAFWTKYVQQDEDKQLISLVFDDLQLSKNGFVTYRDIQAYFYGFELVFLYQKNNTDSHISIGLFNNQTADSIIRSEIPSAQSLQLKTISFTSRKVLNIEKSIVLHSIKQSFKYDNNNNIVDMKAFDDYSPEQGQPFETIDLTATPNGPQPCIGLEVKVVLQAKNEIFGNQSIDYSVTSIRPLFKPDGDQAIQNFKEINERQSKVLGPIAVQPQTEQNTSPQTQREEQPPAQAAEENRERLPVPDPAWNTGKFLINVNRCTRCDEHITTTWHDEADFIEKFIQFGEFMKSCFPNCEIVGNHDAPGASLENFDVYIRGVGPEHQRDEQGRVWLYNKSEGMFSFLYNFSLRIVKAYDKLVLLSAGYGNTVEMEKMQEYYITRFETMMAKKWAKSHGHPCEVQERKIEIQRKIEEENTIKEGTKMACRNWGCGQAYDYTNDPTIIKYACRFHPGSYQLGSIHALWPESWTCCRGEWASRGCKRGMHKGIVERKLLFLCLNVGEINPKTKRPDSACGQSFSDEVTSDCIVHAGYFKKTKITSDEGEWTCCQDGNPNSSGCQNLGGHKKAEWPDVEAKKYFVEKPVFNRGLISFSGKKLPVLQEVNEPYKKAALKACVYRESKPYTPFVNQQRRQQEERKLNENEYRVCIHYGCQKKTGGVLKPLFEFNDVENEKFKEKRKKNCKYHSGTFDFGHTGVTTVSQATTDTLWEPHWSCCRKEWESEGCQQGYHDGPLRSEFVEHLSENAKGVLDHNKQIEEQQRLIKRQEDSISDRYSKDENEKNNELSKLPQRYNEEIHHQVQEQVQIYSQVLEQTKKNPRAIIDFYEKEHWPNPRAMKHFHKIISTTWKKKLEGYQVGAHEIKGLYVDENEIKNMWAFLFKKEDSVSFGRLSGLCDKLHLHLFAVSDRLDYHFKFWDVVKGELSWFSTSGQMPREKFIEWWFMDVDRYLDLKEEYKEEQRKKQQKTF